MAISQQPTHQDLYINLDSISEALMETPPPPVPPRTHRNPSADEEEAVDHRDRANSGLQFQNKADISNRGYGGSQKSKTPPSSMRIASREPPPEHQFPAQRDHAPRPPVKPKPHLSGKTIVNMYVRIELLELCVLLLHQLCNRR